MNRVRHGSSATFETKSSHCLVARQSLPCYTAVARLSFKRRAPAVLKSNLVRRRLNRASAYPASLQALHSNLTQKQIIQIQHNMIKNPNWQEAASWLFTSAAEDLNPGRPRINPESGQSGTRTRDRRIASPTC